MNSSPSTSRTARLIRLVGWFFALLFFPITIPIAVATNYRGAADRLSSLPGIRHDGGLFAGVSVLVYLLMLGGFVVSVTTVTVPDGENSAKSATNDNLTDNSVTDGISSINPTSTPERSSASTTDSTSSTSAPTDTADSQTDTDSNKYSLLLSDIEEVYPAIARRSYQDPYLEFIGGSYDQERKSVTLNFSTDSLNSIDRYEIAVSRTAAIYVRSHFNPKTAYPKIITLNYFRDGKLNATAKIRSRWMRQYLFGNISSTSPAPMSYRTYIRAVVGTLKVQGEKIEFQRLLERCDEENPTNSGQCKNSLRDRMPVRLYLPERTPTGGTYTNIVGEAAPNRSFGTRKERLRFMARKLEQNITGTAHLEGYTPALETKVWQNVDMRIRDVYLDNETIVVEQFTRSEVGDDSLPLQQRDIIGATYGRLAVNYGSKYIPANGIIIVQYTSDGKKYAKVRVPNYNAVGYISGERDLIELGTDIQIIERYQEPGS